MTQLLDLHGFVGVVLRAADLAARTALLSGGAFWALLLSHTHAIANPREALLMELSHLPLAVLAAVGGGARWTGLRGPPELARPAAAVWAARLILIGVLPLVHREA